MPKPRIRDLGYGPGFYEPGPRNSILDIPGLQLGQKTIYDPDNGIHVGVTIFFPRGTTNTRTKPSYAAIFSLNGAGELTGNHFIDNWGFTNSPIAFTDSMSIGAVYQSLVTHGWGVSRELGEDPETGYAHFGFPVVGETWGGGVTDIQGGKSTLSHEQVMEAIKDAEVRQAVGEGGQGGGAGRETLGWDEAEASVSWNDRQPRVHVLFDAPRPIVGEVLMSYCVQRLMLRHRHEQPWSGRRVRGFLSFSAAHVCSTFTWSICS